MPHPRADAEVHVFERGSLVCPASCVRGVAKTEILRAGRTGVRASRGGDMCGRAARWIVRCSKEGCI